MLHKLHRYSTYSLTHCNHQYSVGSGSWVSRWERRKRICSWRHIVLSTSFIWPVKRFIFLSYSLCFLAGLPFVGHLSVQAEASPCRPRPLRGDNQAAKSLPHPRALPYYSCSPLWMLLSSLLLFLCFSKSSALFLLIRSGGSMPFTEKICISASTSYRGRHSEFTLWTLPPFNSCLQYI